MSTTEHLVLYSIPITHVLPRVHVEERGRGQEAHYWPPFQPKNALLNEPPLYSNVGIGRSMEADLY